MPQNSQEMGGFSQEVAERSHRFGVFAATEAALSAFPKAKLAQEIGAVAFIKGELEGERED